MSFEPTVFADAFWMSAGESDATLLNVNSDCYRLGQIIGNKEIIEFNPAYNNIVHQLMGSWSLKNSKGNYKLTDIAANYKLTNCEVFYGMLGKAPLADGNYEVNKTRDITHLDTTVAVGEKPRYNLLTHSGTDKRQLFGCVLKDVGISWDNGKGYCEARTMYDALSWKTSTWGSGTGEILHPGPDVTADGSFKPFSILETLSWNSDDDALINITSPSGVGLQMSQIISSSPGTGDNLGMKEEIDDSLGIGIGFALGYFGNEAQFIKDHKSGAKGELIWKMSSPNTDSPVKDIFFEVTATNCNVFEPMPFRENGKTVAYTTMLKAETLSIVGQDYLNDYFYTYPR